MFGHIPELIGLLVLGLIIFGPKRMIELGGQLGRTLREMRSVMKDMSWNPLSDDASNPTGSSQSTLGRFSQLAQDFTAQRSADAAEPSPTSHTVDAAPQPASNDTPTEAL
ncbi:MAG TPA: twin-arginine translocase TatA/TatE family subunit [Ktedonobacterales bacterium]|nr:twin-arginine translocase TatA/TatE family subunit [Ktedonobacterales bacterium]